MTSRYGIVNILLFFIIFLLIFKNDEVWTLPQLEYKKEAGKIAASPTEAVPALAVTQGSSLRESLVVIAEINCFLPDRKEF
ncbi:MAG: hypothetical protein Q7W38_04965, partial [Deltaproteobacteria bacterium]|nr:hypothetical protein [Deltaproteobacteria bacterium]